jgi:hypothetical protein
MYAIVIVITLKKIENKGSQKGYTKKILKKKNNNNNGIIHTYLDGFERVLTR